MERETLSAELDKAMPGTDVRAVIVLADGTPIKGVIEKVTMRRPPAGRAYIELLVGEDS